LKPERWGPPLVQQKSYQGEKACGKRQQQQQQHNNNNNNNNYKWRSVSCVMWHRDISTLRRQSRVAGVRSLTGTQFFSSPQRPDQLWGQTSIVLSW
jgi:hypothetical protein